MVRFGARCSLLWIFVPVILFAGKDPTEEARKEIVAAYQKSFDGLRRGDADAALQIDTKDWVSLVVGQKPRSRAELEPFVRRDIASMKPPAGWSVEWQPDYERNGTISGIQIYELKLVGDGAVVLCLVGSTKQETSGGISHSVWRGSHVRDTWINGPEGWKRRMHEKLTVNEQMIDGKAAKASVDIATNSWHAARRLLKAPDFTTVFTLTLE